MPYPNSLGYIKILYFIFEFGLYLTTLLRAQLSILEMFCVAASVALSLIRILISYDGSDVISFFLWIYVDASLLLWVQIKTILEGISPPGSTLIMLIGVSSLLFLLIVAFLGKPLYVRATYRFAPFQGYNRWMAIIFVMLVVICGYLSTWLSDYMGIAVMGRERKNYSFHIAGLLENFRFYLYPVLLLVVIDYSEKFKFPARHLSVFIAFGWYVYEGLVRLSKGSLVFFALLYGLYLVYFGKIRLLHFASLAVLLVISLQAYNIIQFYRYESSGSFSLKDFIDYRERSQEMETSIDNDRIVHAYTRFFMAGSHLSTLYAFLEENGISFSDISNTFPKDRSPSKIMTHYVKQFPEGVRHSEGSTFLTEGLLYTGPLGLLLGLASFSMLCLGVDSSPFLRKRVALQAGIAYNLYLSMNNGIYNAIFFHPQIGIGMIIGLAGIASMYSLSLRKPLDIPRLDEQNCYL